MRLRVGLWLAMALAIVRPAHGQFEAPLLSKVFPNLVNPGGKSLAMGGAFVALADDATAAFANPAGLPALGSWELGMSGKNFLFKPKLSTDNFLENPAGTLTPQGSYLSEPTGGATELEYASLVIPIVENLTFAAYRAVNLRYRLDASDLVGGNYRAFYVNRGGASSLSFDEQGGVDLGSEVYGASLGARLSKVLSIGGGVTLSRLRYDLTGGSAGGGHLVIANADNGSRTNDPSAPRIDATVSASVASGTKAGWIAGFKLDLAEAPRLSVGGVYRKSPRFDVGYSVSAVYPAYGTRVSFSCGVDDPSVPGSGASACGSFKVPDDWSIGLSISPLHQLTVVAEVQRVLYSQFNDGYVPLFTYTACPEAAGAGCTAGQAVRAISKGSSDDGTVPRLGAEYTLEFSSGTQLSLRGGWYREPAHGTKISFYPQANRQPASGTPVVLVNPPFSQAFATSFDGGQAESHGSFGVGLVLGRFLAVDVAADLAKTSRQLVVSAFLRL